MSSQNPQTIIETSQYTYKLIEQIDQQFDGTIFKALNIEKNEFVILIVSKMISDERLKQLKHFQQFQEQNLINVQDYIQKEYGLIIIMDWVDGSFVEVYQTLKNNQMQVKIGYLIQIAKGLKVLHKFKLIYQDLNPYNIAFIKLQNGDFQLKLFIPGLPRPRKNYSRFAIFDQYKPYEQIKSLNYSQKIDIWAFGMICYEVIGGKEMLQTAQAQSNQILACINQLFCLKEIKILLSQMLTIEFSQRLEAESIFERLQLIRENLKTQSQIQFKQFQQPNLPVFAPQNKQSQLKIDQEQYILQKNIYETPNVTVYEAENTLTKQQVVIKKQNKQSDKELVVLQKIKEANLKHFIKIINFCQQQNDYYIVMEKAHGSLQDILKSGVSNILIKDRIEWFKQIVKGVIELHELGIIHRDLKPANILFKKDQIGNYIFLLCDTDVTTLDNWTVKTHGVGTQFYKAPEIWSQNYNEKVDIWSLGLIFYELLVDEKTLNKEFKLKKLNSQLQYDYMQNAIDSLPIETGHKKLLKGVLQKDVETRFSANDVLSALESDRNQGDDSQKNAQYYFQQFGNQLQDVKNLKQQVNGNQIFVIQQNQVQNTQQQALKNIEVQKLKQERLEKLRQEEQERQRLEKQNEELYRKFEQENLFKPNTYNRLSIGQEQYILHEIIYDTPNVTVYEAENTITKQQVVIKKQNKQSDKELVVLQKIKEANLKHFIKIINFCQQQSDYFIVMEKAHGSLNDILQSGVQNILIKDRIEWFKQIVNGIIELHELEIIHRDLKPANILFKRDQIGNYIFLLCDTDTTTLDNFAVKTHNVGTQFYKAPEIWSENYNEKVDIWSLGLIFYELLVDENTLNKEFKLTKLNQKRQYQEIHQAIVSLPIEIEQKKLLKGMLEIDVKMRFSAKYIIQSFEKQFENSSKDRQKHQNQLENQYQQKEFQQCQFQLQEQKQQEFSTNQSSTRNEEINKQELQNERLPEAKKNIENQDQDQEKQTSLQLFEEHQYMLQKKRDTLKSQMMCVNDFISNTIDNYYQQSYEITNYQDQQIVEVVAISQQIKNFINYWDEKQAQLQAEYDQVDQFTTQELKIHLQKYETRLQYLQESHERQSKKLAILYSDIENEQIENEQIRKDLENQYMNLQNQMNQKKQQSEQASITINNQIEQWEKTLKDCPFSTPEIMEKFKTIKSIADIIHGIFLRFNLYYRCRPKIIKHKLNLVQKLIEKLNDLIPVLNNEDQRFTELSNCFQQQKEIDSNFLQNQKLNLLTKIEDYSDEVRLLCCCESEVKSVFIQQLCQKIIYKISKMEQIKKEVKVLEFQVKIDDQKLSFDEKQLKHYEKEVEKQIPEIDQLKEQLTKTLNERREALKIQSKCQSSFNELSSQSNLSDEIENHKNQLISIQSRAYEVNNEKIYLLTKLKIMEIKKEESENQKLQQYLKENLFGDRIKTEDQYQSFVRIFQEEIQNAKNSLNSQKKSIQEYEYQVSKYEQQRD